jgi:hydrogenase maturation protein HypF
VIVERQAAARWRLAIRGAVQGVGFRPFVYRLAVELGLSGWVRNSAAGVSVEVEGPEDALAGFLRRLQREAPARASIHGLEHVVRDREGDSTFEIRESDPGGAAAALVQPDIATCAECLRDVFDPADRRHRYPFTNCTHCGPRHSILEALPYDRHHTTMRGFRMCARCAAEYHEPRNRRFHAQPNACPDCGPHLELWDPSGKVLSTHDRALLDAATAVRRGAVVAVKGLGGFHVLADARNEDAVRRLRARKKREDKPFALMARTLEEARRLCEVTALEASLLSSPESPIVLMRRRPSVVAASVAPANPYLGVMLAYAPLHHLLLSEVGLPVVATSGNLSDEPICKDNDDALAVLASVADLFLVHDRPIARRIDDSIVRFVAGRALVLRRARGFAPLPIALRMPVPPIVAVGGQLKNTTAVAVGRDVFLSQHVGDLETPQAFDAFRESLKGFERLYGARPALVACDAHPGYGSTRFAEAASPAPFRVQHHHAHVLSCLADNELDPPVLGVAWDGTGYGPDGTIWGGEFLRVTREGFTRVAHLRRFRLPGGERAVREPRRAALGVLYEIFGEGLPPPSGLSVRESATLVRMIEKGVNSPATSSAGRLFDAIAALAGLRERASFEGQAAMDLEFALLGVETDEYYEGASTDWEPIVRGVLRDLASGVPVPHISARLHNSLVEVIVGVAQENGEERVLLTGGCFQNKYLTERAVRRLREAGFEPYWHRRVPPNDGGLALGQVLAAAMR